MSAISPAQSVADFDAADAAFRDRYATLKFRASLVGASGIVGWSVALLGILIFGNPLAEWLVRLAISGDGIDIPETFFRHPGSEVNGLALLFAFMCVGFVGVASGLKRGLARSDVIVWVSILGAVAGCTLYSQSRIFSMMGEWSDAQMTVRVIRKDQMGLAETMLPNGSMESQYVLAQKALRDGHEHGLKMYAEPLLVKLDQLLLRMDGGRSAEKIPDLRIDVLQRLDEKLYGAPYSQVSLGSAATRASWWVRQWHVVDIAGVVGSLLLAGLSTAALLLFLRMVHRLARLRGWLGIG